MSDAEYTGEPAWLPYEMYIFYKTGKIMSDTKFKVGDRVRIVNYGHLIYVHPESTMLELFTSKPYSKSKEMVTFDLNPRIIGTEWIITEAKVIQGIDGYEIHNDTNTIAWVHNNQLELINKSII